MKNALIPESDYESVRVNNLFHKMTLWNLDRVYRFCRWQVKCAIWTVAEFLHDYIHSDVQKRPDLVDQNES